MRSLGGKAKRPAEAGKRVERAGTVKKRGDAGPGRGAPGLGPSSLCLRSRPQDPGYTPELDMGDPGD